MLKDGVAALALVALASASTLIGLACYWRLPLASPPLRDIIVPKGDISIRTHEGAFAIIHCSEDIARELFMGPEYCDYLVSDQSFKILAGIALSLVTVSVILLGNSSWTMQAVIAAIYIVLNILYWIVSLLSPRRLWDFSQRYKCDLVKLHRGEIGNSFPSFTRSLWLAIQATGEIEWIRQTGAAPQTPEWEKWLELARRNSHNPNWDAVAKKNEIMRGAMRPEPLPTQMAASRETV